MNSIQSSTSLPIDDKTAFINTLKALNKKTLNSLDQSQIPRSLRKFIHEERIRRKLAAQTRRQTQQSQTDIAVLEAETNEQIQETRERIDELTATFALAQIINDTGNGFIVTTYPPPDRGTSASQAEPNNQLVEETYCMFPELHYLIQEELPLEDLVFNPNDNEDGMLKEKDISNFGSLNCNRCRKKWMSGYIATTVRLYRNDSYNARVYFQRCRRCNSTIKPELDISAYQERVSLTLKKWFGYEVKSHNSGPKKQTKPHDEMRCEGCKVGHCPYSKYH